MHNTLTKIINCSSTTARFPSSGAQQKKHVRAQLRKKTVARGGLRAYTQVFLIPKLFRLFVKLIGTCTVAALSLLSSCGTVGPVAELQGNDESVTEKDTTDHRHRRLQQGALIISGAVVTSCLVIARVRKLCARIVAPERVKNVAPSPADDKMLLSVLQSQQRNADKLAELHEELVVLRKEYENFRADILRNGGRQANINGFAFENDTVQSLSLIIPDLYKGERVRKVVRNIEGSFSSQQEKGRGFEIDAIAITNKRVFVIETKVTLKRKDVDAFVARLEKFHQLNFADKELNNWMRDKPVHGGLSYYFDATLEIDDSTRTMQVSKYAREYKLLTIPRLLSDKARPKQVAKLRDFR